MIAARCRPTDPIARGCARLPLPPCVQRGLDPDFSPAALAEVRALAGPPGGDGEPTRDLRSLLWCSIDNDDSRDLDQLSVAEPAGDGAVKVMVAIADVDAAVPKGSLVDRHAALNTTSVYTPAVVFPMLPERLSTDLTSLNEREDRLAMVIEFVVSREGELSSPDVYRALCAQPREARLQRGRRVVRPATARCRQLPQRCPGSTSR